MNEVRRLRLLREVATYKTITAAAEVYSPTPSAGSQQLSLLEREAGVPLLVRDGRRLASPRRRWCWWSCYGDRCWRRCRPPPTRPGRTVP